MQIFHKSYIATLVACCVSTHVYALTDNTEEKNNRLPEIVVYGEQNQSLSSIQMVDREEMKKTPVANGNITDYLKSNPHIRNENSDQDNLLRGEIKPENISINGADFNQTAFFVDNVNVNNDLGVDGSIFDGAIKSIPDVAHTQGYFFDASMLSKVEVHDHNISASLGGFTGGAVVAKTKQYNGKDGIKLKYRTTNSSWASLKTDEQVRQKLAKVRPDGNGVAELQPKYNKQSFSIMAEKGLTENLGMVVGFSRRTSHIEQNRLIGFAGDEQFDKEDHTRRSDNAFLNFNFTPNNGNRFELGLRYSNYREEKYLNNNIDSNIADYHQAYGATLAWVREFKSGVLTSTLAYDQFSDKRKSSSANAETVSVMDEYFEPLYNYEKGGYGNSDLTQRNWHFSTEYALNPIDWGNTNHSISVGGIYQATAYKFNRAQDVYGSIKTIIGKSIDEYRSITPKGSAKTDYQNVVLYAEDLIKWATLEFRPGVRVERDDYLKNTNIAPRFVARYTPWDDTAFTLGLNRYYGRSFASLKLSQEILRINNNPTRRYQDFSSLKTPYADELSLGFDQNWQNLAFKLNYIHRKNKNRIIMRKSGNDFSFQNGRDYSVDVYAFQVNNIEPWKWGKSYWNASLGFDWLQTKATDLDMNFNPDELVYLDGKLMNRREMQHRVNANSEDWIARVGLDMTIPDYHLTWSNKVYLKAPIKGVIEIDGNFGDDISRYRSYDYGRHTQWDSSLRWQPTISGNHSVYVQVDVLNVLNQTRKIKNRSISTNDEYGIYTAGREFWLELGYEF
ncbi:TonB-dependent receptor plug domain-containing protein [Rodentibacter caecimuris]|uniref:TonB-dependent receptor n=1 Tax=Rodentibacter caecimuris TaxID=1796644 RepID=A0ABX3KY91_9PAST|nr:TonB-dependent receptor [Rodentibacter heylii]